VLLRSGLGVPLDYSHIIRFHEPKALVRKYTEAMEIMTELWTDEPFSFDGEVLHGGRSQARNSSGTAATDPLPCWHAGDQIENPFAVLHNVLANKALIEQDGPGR